MRLNESFNCPEFLCNDNQVKQCQMIVLMIKRHNACKTSLKATMVIASTKYFFCALLFSQGEKTSVMFLKLTFIGV